jgi:F-type H+-transporting ATPase subunit b
VNLNATLFAQLVVFFILVAFTAKFVWPPLRKAIDDRRDAIALGLSKAEKAEQQLKEATAQRDAQEKEARAKAAEIIANAEKRAQQLLDEAKQNATAEGERLIAQAHAQIAQDIATSRLALQQDVASLVVFGANQILQREVNPADHADVLDRLVLKAA